MLEVQDCHLRLQVAQVNIKSGRGTSGITIEGQGTSISCCA